MIKKPRYKAVSPAQTNRLRTLYQSLASNLERAWHQSSRALFDLNREYKAKGKRIPEMEWLMAYDVVWQYYDLRTRAALYLCDESVPRLSRLALKNARDDTHGIDSVAIAAYVDLFPYTMFQHHGDLDWYSGQRYRLRLPKIESIKAASVLDDFAFYIEARHKTPSSPKYTEYVFVTVQDSEMLKLETSDYEEVLEYSSDGRSYYIR